MFVFSPAFSPRRTTRQDVVYVCNADDLIRHTKLIDELFSHFSLVPLPGTEESTDGVYL